MFNVFTIAIIALSAVSAVSGLAIPRATKPATYAEGYLEPYVTYHKRYMDLGCNLKHNTTFFDACCHPMLATETLEKNRAPECNPANQPADSSDDGDCDESSAVPSSTPSSTPAATPSPSPTPAPVNAGPEPPKAPISTPPAEPTHTTPPPAPSPSKTPEPSPSPSSKPAPPKPTPAKPAPAPSSGSSGNQVNSGGFATFFFQNGNPGACGKVNPDSAFIAAIDQDRYGNSGNASPLCGKQVKITNTNNGKTVTVTIADDCPTCVNSNSIDLSVGAFTAIATEAEGMVPITWEFL